MAHTNDVLLPDIGDFKDVEVIEILVAPGDSIAAEQSIMTLESDKATMEIPAPRAGVVGELKIKVGDRLNRGDLLLTLIGGDSPAGAAEPAAVPDVPATPAAPAPVADEVVVAADPVEIEVHLPDIGDFPSVEVIEILVGVGDIVAAEQSILTLESDKATMEIPSPAAGMVTGIQVKLGDKISKGDLIMRVSQGPVDAAQPAAAAVTAVTPSAPVALEPAPRMPGDPEHLRRPVIARPSDAPAGRAHASPAVRRFARELGVDLVLVAGSGPKGRVTKEDVQDYVKRTLASGSGAAPSAGSGAFQLPGMPEIDFSKFGEIEQKELGRIKKLSGAHLHRSWLTVPHVTQFDEADITELEAFRKDQKQAASDADVKLTFMPFLLKAVAAALHTYPQFNSSLASDGTSLIYKKYVHIGVAVDTPNGLVVPVVRDVDKKGVFELARELGELSAKARAGKLAPGDMQGGCISISSLGGIGGTQFAPIVNMPEVAILGISRAEMKPKWNGSEFLPRLMMPFSLAYDHRVIDGVEGVRFTTYLNGMLGDIRRLLL